MKILVLGSGVIGLTSAWYLAQQGHQVTVIDRQPRSADETSFANAGQISYGYSSPWAAPGIPIKAVQWLMQQHAPLKIKPHISPAFYHWLTQFLQNCRTKPYQVNKARMLRIANYSRECLAELRTITNISYEGRQQGTLQVFRDHKQLEALNKDLRVLTETGTRYQLLNNEQCLQFEPGLALAKDKIIAGLHLPDDETGDCFEFCQQLTQLAQRAGVKFNYQVSIEKLHVQGKHVTAVQTSKGLLTADCFVVALGSYSAAMLRPLGIHLPVYPVKGYSLTMPIANSNLAPSSTVMDESYKVAITRFDERIRVAGTAELAGFNLSLPQPRKETLAMVMSDLFPQGGDLTQAEFWTGLRPMTPDGTPIIGATSYSNLFTNTGHGTLGWTMACGSGKLLADIISKQTPDIDTSGLDHSRYLS